MFPRGARFPQEKISDVPGPNAYNPQDPDFDAYKRGAFLEKTNRFAKDKPSDVPGPGTYDPDMKPSAHKPTGNASKPSSSDRYAALQRKVEDLERIHAEGKKTYQAEIERLKQELHRANKLAAEQSDRADKLKKQNDALDARVQELKKTSATEQAEARDLRVKLRAAEHEKTQLAAKQNDMSEVRKALQAADAKRKDDLRDRDRKVAELEKALGSEKKKREAAETRLLEMRSKVDSQIHDAQNAASDLRSQLKVSEAEVETTKASLLALKARASDTEQDLLDQLDQHRSLLSRVADEYGRLASTTVSASIYERTKHDRDAAQLRIFRLERKLGNVEDQVTELANLVRYTKETNTFLAERWKEATKEAAFYAHELRDATSKPDEADACAISALQQDLAAIQEESFRQTRTAHEVVAADLKLWNKLYRLRNDALLLHGSALLKGVGDAQQQVQVHLSQLSRAEAQQAQLSAAISAAQATHTDAQVQLAQMTASLATSSAENEALKKQLEDARTLVRTEVAKVEQTLQKEKEGNHRLSSVIQKSKQAEEGLRAEVEQLGAELAQAERYEEAYNNLVEEVGALVDRNALAEGEAERLRKFNAEILGHNNPAQRIMYVDRIRRELYETKQQLLMMTRDKETVIADNDELRNELALYTSVAVPQEVKPRTAVTRVGRVPLASHNPNVDNNLQQSKLGTSNHTSSIRASTGASKLERVSLPSLPEWQSGQEDMTLDEIM